jgi:hypothetical protein
MISPAQFLAVEALVRGASVTEAAGKAGVARETVSRWMHRDPAFMAELQNTRALIAVHTRCALEALGHQAVEALREALQGLHVRGTRLRSACAVLKLIGADRTETIPTTTAEEVHLRLRQREAELQKYESLLCASKIIESQGIDRSYGPTEASPATAMVEEEPGSGAPVASDEPENPGNQALKSTEQPPFEIPEGKPDSREEKGPVDGDRILVHQRSGFLKDVAGHFDELNPGADQVPDGETDQEPLGQRACHRAAPWHTGPCMATHSTASP